MAAENEFPKVNGDIAYASEYNGQAGQTITVEAGETIAAGDVVFIYGSGHANEGEAWKSDADVQDKCRANGIAISGGNDGDDITIQTSGIYYETATFTDKETYYLSTTAGGFTTTASGVKLGFALSTGTLHLNIVQDDRDIVTTLKSVLPNHANMISNWQTAFWKLCDGTAIADAESPLNGGEAPDLNANALKSKFLRGAATSDDGTDNTAVETPTHVHGPSDLVAIGTGGVDAWKSTNSANNNVDALPPYIDVVWIMKIK